MSISTIKTALRGVVALTAIGTVAIAPAASAQTGPAHVDLRVAVTAHPNETYEPRTTIQVPATHKIGDNIFPYEGVGWENEIVGYRLYLDERAVTDIFGKKTPGIALDKVDYRSKYHEPRGWGQDVMHVGPSLGVGGLGLYRGEALERFGASGPIFAEIIKRDGPEVAFKIKHRAVPIHDGKTASVDATYSISTGSPLTWVTVKSTAPGQTLASGLVMHPDAKFLKNTNETKKGEWRYIATWGKQSEAKDELGTVLFFRAGDARIMPTQKETRPIRFNTPNPTYAFAGVWTQGPMGIHDEVAFVAWCDHQLAKMPR